MDTFSRFSGFWFVFFVSVFVLFSPPLAHAQDIPAYDPSHYEKIFGKPEDFVKKLEADISPKLNEYLGLGVSVSGFILVLRSLVK